MAGLSRVVHFSSGLFSLQLKTERNDSVIYSLIHIKVKPTVVFLWLQRFKHKLTECETSDGGSVQILQKEIKKRGEYGKAAIARHLLTRLVTR